MARADQGCGLSRVVRVRMLHVPSWSTKGAFDIPTGTRGLPGKARVKALALGTAKQIRGALRCGVGKLFRHFSRLGGFNLKSRQFCPKPA